MLSVEDGDMDAELEADAVVVASVLGDEGGDVDAEPELDVVVVVVSIPVGVVLSETVDEPVDDVVVLPDAVAAVGSTVSCDAVVVSEFAVVVALKPPAVVSVLVEMVVVPTEVVTPELEAVVAVVPTEVVALELSAVVTLAFAEVVEVMIPVVVALKPPATVVVVAVPVEVVALKPLAEVGLVLAAAVSELPDVVLVALMKGIVSELEVVVVVSEPGSTL